jgi:ferritin-like metal-binding protein YciE
MQAGTSPKLSPEQFKKLFIHQLNRINCAKGYLIKNLPALKIIASFQMLKLAIQEDLDDVKKQLLRVQDIYELLDAKASDEGCEVLIAVIEQAYKLSENEGKTSIITDMDIILYLQLIEHIEMTTYRMLKMIATYLGNKQIEQMILECFHETEDNDLLYELIAEEYLGNSTGLQTG